MGSGGLKEENKNKQLKKEKEQIENDYSKLKLKRR